MRHREHCPSTQQRSVTHFIFTQFKTHCMWPILREQKDTMRNRNTFFIGGPPPPRPAARAGRGD
jgi:hypothetical protein